jgi:signal transduction histidine kinase
MTWMLRGGSKISSPMETPDRRRCVLFTTGSRPAQRTPIFTLQPVERTVLAFLHAGVREFLVTGDTDEARRVYALLQEGPCRHARVRAVENLSGALGSGEPVFVAATDVHLDRRLIARFVAESHAEVSARVAVDLRKDALAAHEGAARAAFWPGGETLRMAAESLVGADAVLTGLAFVTPGFARVLDEQLPEKRSLARAFTTLAAREPVHRIKQLSEATLAWRQGDFTKFVDDSSGDELGQLAQRLNDMALQLEHLLETRRELAVVEERNRLARELHDSVKQQAFAAAAQISGVRTLVKRDPEMAEAHLEEAERLIYELRQELTSLILELRPAVLDDKGLASAVRKYAADWSRQNGIKPEVRVQGERSLPLDIEQPLFRIMQESLANVARHSKANNVEIGLVYANGEVTLTVTDDGRGFDINRTHSGFGLISMGQRVEPLEGNLTVESTPGKGTSISCTVPVSSAEGNG